MLVTTSPGRGSLSVERTETGWGRTAEPPPRWRSLLDRALLGRGAPGDEDSDGRFPEERLAEARTALANTGYGETGYRDGYGEYSGRGYDEYPAREEYGGYPAREGYDEYAQRNGYGGGVATEYDYQEYSPPTNGYPTQLEWQSAPEPVPDP